MKKFIKGKILKRYFLKYLKLFLLLQSLLSPVLCLSAWPSEDEIAKLAIETSWPLIYFYEKEGQGFKPLAFSPSFYFARIVHSDPILELKLALEAFRDTGTKWGELRLPAQCAFPARFDFVKKHFAINFPRVDCMEFENWSKELGAEELSIMYAGPYTNNPASMFGHTLIRLKRGIGPWPLDYTVSFLARIDPRDGPISYAFKGIFGGYPGFFQIDPYYINAGQYNNAEGRDLWEYSLGFTEEEIRQFIKLLYEVSLNSGFPYYFLNKNCSYYLSKLLSIVRPEIKVRNRIPYFPIESVKSTLSGQLSYEYRPSLEKRVQVLVDQMNGEQLKKFKKGYVEAVEDPLVLDAWIELDKMNFYGSKGKRTTKEEEKSQALMLARAKLSETSTIPEIRNRVNPLRIHAPGRVELLINPKNIKQQLISIDAGYHGLLDNEIGLTQWSFIDFLGVDIYHGDDWRIDQILLVDIRALNPSTMNFPKLSWRLSSKWERNCYGCGNHLTSSSRGGIGVSSHFERIVFWAYINALAQFSSIQNKVFPTAEVGLKYAWSGLGIYSLVEVLNRNAQLQIGGDYFFKTNLGLIAKATYIEDRKSYWVGLQARF